MDSLLANESSLRLVFFIAIFAVMGIAEATSPRRRREIPRLFRWSNNLSIVVIDSLLLSLIFPLLAVALASIAAANGWGLLSILNLPFWISFCLAILLLDLAIYWQHVLFHRVPFLWRLHRVHHTDLEIDLTTGLRFHPLEILLSMLIKLTLVVLLGPPALAVLVFEILLNGASMFNHSNLRLAPHLDKWLRRVLVTPDMHRVHHSVLIEETNSNYGFFIPWWDRLFKTYRDQPKNGHQGMQIGIAELRDMKEMRIDRLLLQPLRSITPSSISVASDSTRN